MKTIIKAGAGAGKTWTLTRQVVSLAQEFYKKEGRWPKIVVTTFTRKATQELRERILEYCLTEKPEAVDFAQSETHLFMTTIHGLLDRYLRSQGHHMGLPNQYKIIDSGKGLALRKNLLKNLFKENSEYCQLLDDFDFRKLLKLFSEMEELGYSETYKPATFESLQRAAQQSWDECRKKIGTLSRTICSHSESEDWPIFGESLFAVSELQQEDWGLLRSQIASGMSSLKPPRKSKKNPSLDEATAKELLNLRKAIKVFSESAEYDPVGWKKSEDYLALLDKVFRAYQAQLRTLKIESGELEVSDLEPFSEQLMAQFPQATSQFAKDWEGWFVDEFQDTSPLQLQLLRSFIAEAPAFFVGDPQQSIYLFRGARSEVFSETEAEILSQEGGRRELLVKNYRSQESFLNFVNDFFPTIQPSFSTMEATVPVENAEAVELLKAVDDDNDRELEVSGIVTAIDDLLKKGVAPKEIAILGRTNKNLLKISKALSRGHYPFISHSSVGFFARTEIQDALALLSVLVNPMDDFKLIQFLRSPWFPMSDQEIVDLVAQRKDFHWLTFEKHFKAKSYEPGLQLLKYCEMARKVSVPWALRQAIIDFGMIETSFDLDSGGRVEANLWKLINLLEKNSREAGVPLLDILENQAMAFDLENDSSEDAASAILPDKINLMTVHSSKGLQFQYVFVPFLDKKLRQKYSANFSKEEGEKIWSTRLPVGDEKEFIGNPIEKKVLAETASREQDEFLRLFYVAMTRAKEKVFLSWSGSPKESSWGELLETFFDKNPAPKGYSFRETLIETSEAPVFSVAPESGVLPEAWQDLSSKESEKLEKTVESSGNQLERNPQSLSSFIKAQEKRLFGIWVHDIFEFLGQDNLEERLAQLPEMPGDELETIHKAIEYVENLKVPNLIQLAREGFREWSYQMQTSAGVKEGRVDLWGIQDETLWVVDFKTGSSSHKDKAFEQMETYAKILSDSRMGLSFKEVQLMALYPMESSFFTKDYKNK